MRLTYTHEAMEELAFAVKHYRRLGGAFFQRVEVAEEEKPFDEK